jgi:hypothetical protein
MLALCDDAPQEPEALARAMGPCAWEVFATLTAAGALVPEGSGWRTLGMKDERETSARADRLQQRERRPR